MKVLATTKPIGFTQLYGPTIMQSAWQEVVARRDIFVCLTPHIELVQLPAPERLIKGGLQNCNLLENTRGTLRHGTIRSNGRLSNEVALTIIWQRV